MAIKQAPEKINHKIYPAMPPTKPETTKVSLCVLGMNLKITI